jgi:AcrR family transcriptional regulator
MGDRREVVLRSCERLLHRYGPQKTTIQDIARDAQVSVGSVYLEFDSKEAILGELSMRSHEVVLAAIRRAIDSDKPYAQRIRDALDARTDAFLAIAESGHHGGDLLHCAHAAVREEHEKYKAAEQEIFTELLRAGARAAELTAPKPELAARTLLTAYARFAPPWLFHGRAEETKALLRAMHELVLHGLVKRDDRTKKR